MKRSRGHRNTVVAVVLLVLPLIWSGCGDTEGAFHSGNSASRLNDEESSMAKEKVRIHQWGISEVSRESILIGSLVDNCEGVRSKPHFDLERERKRGSLVLTMFVRFPSQPRPCSEGRTGVLHWVKIGPKLDQIHLYDGSMPPPLLPRDSGARREGAQPKPGSGRHVPGLGQRGRPVQWRILEPPTESTVSIGNYVGYCPGSRRVPRISGVRQINRPQAVILTAYFAGRPPHISGSDPCVEALIGPRSTFEEG